MAAPRDPSCVRAWSPGLERVGRAVGRVVRQAAERVAMATGSSERRGEARPRDRVGSRDRAIMRGTTCPGGLLVPFSKLWVTSWLNAI